MATTSIDYKHPYASLQWLHLPTGGSWQDASLLSGYVGGQGTKTLEISSATSEETGFLKCVLTNPAGGTVESDPVTLTGEAQAPSITVGIINKTPYEGESAVYGPITVTGSPAPTLTWEAETADGNNNWADADTVFGADGSGQATDTYTIANTQPADNRDVRVRATNTAGEDISQAALTVTPTLAFVGAEPTDKTISATGASEYLHDFTTKQIGAWTHTRTSVATAPDESGVIQTYASGEPAWYRDQGLQLEDSSTNKVDSSSLTGGSWINSGATISTHGTILDPAGDPAQDVADNGVNSGVVYSSVYSDASDTASIYARTVSGSGTAHLLAGRNNASPNLETLTDAWQRFDYTMPDEWLHAIDYRSGSGGTPSLGEALLAFPQTEAKTFATSYIPTSGSTVTRSATFCSATFAELGAPLPAGGLTNDFCFQLVVSFSEDWEDIPISGDRLLSIAGSESSRCALTKSFADRWTWETYDVSRGAQSCFFLQSEWVDTVPKAGEAWDFRVRNSSTSGCTVWMLGAKRGNVNDTQGLPTDGVDTVDLGSHIGGINIFSSVRVHKFRIVPEALSDEDIEAWT